MEPDVWTQSSHCHTSSCCVEVQWRKSSFSHQLGDCVEVAVVRHTADEKEKTTDET